MTQRQPVEVPSDDDVPLVPVRTRRLLPMALDRAFNPAASATVIEPPARQLTSVPLRRPRPPPSVVAPSGGDTDTEFQDAETDHRLDVESDKWRLPFLEPIDKRALPMDQVLRDLSEANNKLSELMGHGTRDRHRMHGAAHAAAAAAAEIQRRVQLRGQHPPVGDDKAAEALHRWKRLAALYEESYVTPGPAPPQRPQGPIGTNVSYISGGGPSLEQLERKKKKAADVAAVERVQTTGTLQVPIPIDALARAAVDVQVELTAKKNRERAAKRAETAKKKKEEMAVKAAAAAVDEEEKKWQRERLMRGEDD